MHTAIPLSDVSVPQQVLFSCIFNIPTMHMLVRTVQDLVGTHFSSNMALLLSPSHTVTGSDTSPGSSGTGCWPMSLATDCGPHRVDNADRLHTRTACFLAGMISCERRCQSCGGHGRNPSHWHLMKKKALAELISSVMFSIFSNILQWTYQLHQKAEPPSHSAGCCH